jgi:hypothetical protein
MVVTTMDELGYLPKALHIQERNIARGGATPSGYCVVGPTHGDGHVIPVRQLHDEIRIHAPSNPQHGHTLTRQRMVRMSDGYQS